MSIPWAWIESEVDHRLNNLKSDSAADHVTSYETVPKTTAVTDDVAFALPSVRTAIVDKVMEVAALICKTADDPRRLMYRTPASVAHGGTLPSSMGPYGAIFDPVTGRTLEDRSATEIAEIRANVNFAFGNPPPTFFYKAIDGQTLYHTLTTLVTVEYFNLDRPADDYTELAALFDNMNDAAPIPDEFGAIVADGAAGVIAGKAGSLIAEAARFIDLYYAGLRERGLNTQMLPDYPPKPS